MSYSVYALRFPNGKMYIGQTSLTPVKRWENGHGYRGCRKVNNAIQKYGWSSVEKILLCDGLTNEEADEAEKQYILEYKTIENGYNIQTGGLNNGAGIKRSKKTRDAIALAKCKPVNCYDLSGNFIARYFSTLDAAEKTGIKCGQISAARSGRQKTAGGFVWRHDGDSFDKYTVEPEMPWKKVAAIKNGEVIAVFCNANEAEKITGILHQHIHKACKGQRKTAGGYLWKYATEEDNADKGRIRKQH